MVMREVDEDLAIFLGARNEFLQIHNFEEFDDASTSSDPKPDTLLIPNGLGKEASQIGNDDNLLNFETGKSDHNWLYGQQDGGAYQADILSGECIPLNSEPKSAPAADPALQLTRSNSLDSSAAAANKRPASSGGRKPASRAATPTGRPAKSKPSLASRTTATSVKPVSAQLRSSTPSRATSSKPVSRSSTPRSSTPGSKTMAPAGSKPASRSATPTRKLATPSSTISSGSSTKTGSVAIKNPVPIRGGPQTVRSRPSNPSAMLSVSHDAPQTLKKTLPRRPASASRGRPSAPAAKPRQKSCSPTKVRAPISTTHRNGITSLSRSRGYSHGGGDDINPVLMGTQMVERVVNMRKLAPPKQDEHISLENPKKCSHENSGFGRSLSNRSLDMAIRHMDIRRSVSKPAATTVMTYFSSGNQSSSSQSSSFGISESSSTSFSDSSKSSNSGNSYFLDGRRQMDD